MSVSYTHLDVYKRQEETERRLEKIGLNCSLEKYETPFQKEYYQFFKKCNEKRFILLYMAIKRTIETDKVVDQNTLVRFVNIYYASINRSYVRRQGHEEELSLIHIWCSWQTISAPSGRKQVKAPYRGSTSHRLSRWS